jgi:ABC-type tungstate transport system substrate-binding protein
MGNLGQLQSLLTIASTICGFLFVILGVIINSRMGTLKEKIMDRVDTKFSEMKLGVDIKFSELKREMHETMVTKDYFNGKFELLDKKIEWLFEKKNPNNNGQ